MTQRNEAVIPMTEIAERLNVSRATVYQRAVLTGEVYPGVEARRIPGYRRWFVSRSQFERALGLSKPATVADIPVDWFDQP